MSTEAVNIRATDRLSFTIFLALAAHALLIFGLSFSAEKKISKSPTLDVTLAQHKTEEKVELEDADFLADADQVGSGTLDEKKKLESTEIADIEDNQIFHITPEITNIAFKKLSEQNDRIITSESSRYKQQDNTIDDGNNEEDFGELETRLQEVTDVATLNAMLSDKRQAFANRPRVKTITELSTKSASDAKYTHQWLSKVERIGNQNYPEAARKKRLTGAVRLAVSINPDGSLKSVEITGSSGNSVLDQAAKQIVYLASPYEPLTPDILEDNDVLTIIRTWQFRVNNSFGLSDG